MDDPRSAHTLIRTDQDLLDRMPLSTKSNGVTTVAQWTAQLEQSARVLQSASLDPRDYEGWRRKLKSMSPGGFVARRDDRPSGEAATGQHRGARTDRARDPAAVRLRPDRYRRCLSASPTGQERKFQSAGGRRNWVLGLLPPQQNTERLRCTHALELQLADARFPVAQLQHSTDGQTFIGDRTGYYSLHAWVKGRQISIDERERTLAEHSDLVIDLGRLIGRFHRLTAAMTTPDSIPSIEVDRMLMAPKGTARSIRRGRPPRVFKAHQLRFRLRKSEFDWWILDHLPTLYQQAERLAEMSTDGILRASDIVVAHHDVNWENLIFGEDFEPLALLDFDNAVRLQRDIDVGLAAAVLIGPNAERLQSFLSSYADAAQHDVDSSMVAVRNAGQVRSIDPVVDRLVSQRASGRSDNDRDMVRPPL